MSASSERHHRKVEWKNYFPLFIVIGVAFLAALAMGKSMGMFSWKHWMTNFMGLFFLQLATFKFFDLKGFAKGFALYDLPTHYFKPYAYIYPFIELGLALLYLGKFMPTGTNIITLIVMAVSLVGVIKGLMEKKEVVCACLGTVIKVPLSTISIVENVGMGIMALLLFF